MEDFDGKVDYFVDGGPSETGLDSTIVKVEKGIPKILRKGAISEEQIKQALKKYEQSF